VFGPRALADFIAETCTLAPGDLILTGTPQGVALSGRFPYLKAGDVVEIEIEGLGRQRQEFSQA
jgi:2,4-didehydro-3-deoxy-L-rhamnonate hydrolase